MNELFSYIHFHCLTLSNCGTPHRFSQPAAAQPVKKNSFPSRWSDVLPGHHQDGRDSRVAARPSQEVAPQVFSDFGGFRGEREKKNATSDASELQINAVVSFSRSSNFLRLERWPLPHPPPTPPAGRRGNKEALKGEIFSRNAPLNTGVLATRLPTVV